MTDEIHDVNPGQPDNSGQQDNNVDWRGRYTGASQKINELVTQNKALQEQLLAKTSEMEQLRAELSIKSKEGEIAVGARDQRLQELLNEKQTQDTELAKLRALAQKTELAIEMGRPELLAVAKHIPDLQDRDALKVVMEDFAKYGETVAKQREQQLLSGVTLAGGQVGTAAATPSSREAWMRELESKPIGSADRKRVLDDYGIWLQQTNK